mmetsp:Transcript_18759/g.53004  ORF Transcript_18759/g.53004 Transcript_18759/m.53004 type:complete len:574 (+) Transcript_18759:66-1787(+)
MRCAASLAVALASCVAAESVPSEAISRALAERLSAAPPAGSLAAKTLDSSLLGKGCSFCIQANFDFKANFDKLSKAIAGVASEIGDVEKTLEQMSQNFTEGMKQIAHGIEDLAHSVEALGADMLLHIVAMRGFLNTVEAEIDLGILVEELQTAVARVTHRQSMLEPLYKDKNALSPEQKASLVDAILSINEGSDLDTEIMHDVLTGAGGVVPGVQPALHVYMRKGYRLQQLAKVYGAILVYQLHGYGQLFWAYMNKRPIQLLSYNKTSLLSPNRLNTQWLQFGSPIMWHCYWDSGLVCPERQECHTELRGLADFSCNHATAPLTIDTTVGDAAFTLGSASSDSQLMIMRDALTGTCVFGVRDCSGTIPAPVAFNVTNASRATNFTCTTAATVSLSEKGELVVNNGTAMVAANLSASGHSHYALFVNESAGIEIVANGAEVLWSHASPSPASGPCPTDFTKRQLQALSYESCSCITTARWRRVAGGNENVTASWCGRLCQANPQFVAAAPRVDGECWCGTEEALKEVRAGKDDCRPTCLYCPGAPIAGCGINNSIAIYTWGTTSSAPSPVPTYI